MISGDQKFPCRMRTVQGEQPLFGAQSGVVQVQEGRVRGTLH